MRHYFGYSIDGRVRSVEVYGPFGWPVGKCLADPSCKAEAVTSLRKQRATTDPEVVGWAPYDCPCDGHIQKMRDCTCVNSKFGESYVDVVNKKLMDKPLRSVMLNNVPVADQAIVLLPPGTIVELKVVAPGIPDGQTAQFIQRGVVNLLDPDELTLTFTGGESTVVTIATPPAGLRGNLWLGGLMVRPFSLGVQGQVGV